MKEFIESHQEKLILAVSVFVIFIFINWGINLFINRIGKRSNKNEIRGKLISRYSSFFLFLLLFMIESIIFGARWDDISLVFSSVFAILGIALFANWSILSNVTSGVIMFFSFPYKVGDKIEIHDKDYPIKGIIEDIHTFQLHLRLESGDLVTYPNNLILQKAVTLVEKEVFDELFEDR